MAKLGMPSVNIAFTEQGIEAIERSQRGIMALILEESEETIADITSSSVVGSAVVGTAEVGEEGTVETAVTNPFTVYTTDDIPAGLSAANKDYITKALLGYVTSPYRVKVYLQATVESAPDKWAATLKKMYNDRWDYLAIPTIAESECESVATWIKTNRENKNKRVKAVLPKYDADYEGVVNFANEYVETATKKYTTAEYTARIAGLICGTPMTISATYAPLSEVIATDQHDGDENDEKVNAGEFFIFFDGEKFKMSRAMNSLVTTTQGRLEAYQTIKTVDCMDMIYDDIRRTAQDSYIGKYTNDYDNKCLLITAIMGYFKELEAGRLLQKDYSTCEIDVEAVKNYQLKHGLYTQDQLADMSDDEIKKLDTKKQVFLKAKIKMLDAMEDIELNIDI